MPRNLLKRISVDSSPHVMKSLTVMEFIVAPTIIGLAGIAVSASSLLVELANASDAMATTIGGGEREAISTTGTKNNNNSNAVLGNLFLIVEFETASVNPINETYIETSTMNNVTIMPPNAITATTINATETANVTVNILPNGLALDKGQSLIMTEGWDDGTAEQENATTTFADISRMNPDGTGSGTGVVFFSTNSTGQLAFLDNMVGINHSEFSPGGGIIRTWEWKGGTLPLENGSDSAATIGNHTITPSLPPEEG